VSREVARFQWAASSVFHLAYSHKFRYSGTTPTFNPSKFPYDHSREKRQLSSSCRRYAVDRNLRGIGVYVSAATLVHLLVVDSHTDLRTELAHPHGPWQALKRGHVLHLSRDDRLIIIT
jgi:hypothetical protein